MLTTTNGTTTANGKATIFRGLAAVQKGILILMVLTLALLVGQYNGASSVVSAWRADRLKAWAAQSPEHAAALNAYLQCDQGNHALSKEACIRKAATGPLAKELDDVLGTPEGVWTALPKPLSWLLG